MTIDHLLFIAIIIWIVLISIIVIFNLKNKESSMDSALKKSRKDMIDLEAITKNIETNYKPAIIELTSYEQEQENNAIISYQELVNNRNKKNIYYDDNYENTGEINIKKIDLNDSVTEELPQTKIEVTLMSYEKEEAFLKALKQLQSDLVR